MLKHAYVGCRVATYRNDVGDLSGLDSSKVGAEAERACGVARRAADRFQWTHAVVDIQLQFSRGKAHFGYVVDVGSHGNSHTCLPHPTKRVKAMGLDFSLGRDQRSRKS